MSYCSVIVFDKCSTRIALKEIVCMSSIFEYEIHIHYINPFVVFLFPLFNLDDPFKGQTLCNIVRLKNVQYTTF